MIMDDQRQQSKVLKIRSRYDQGVQQIFEGDILPEHRA